MNRPECFDFALEFMGDPESTEVLEYIKELEALVRLCRPYVKEAHDRAEVRHDSDGEYYMDGGQHEIMQETDELLTRINEVIEDQ